MKILSSLLLVLVVIVAAGCGDKKLTPTKGEVESFRRAVESGNGEDVRTMLNRFDNTLLLKTPESGNYTILSTAASNGDLGMVKLLVEHGADVNEVIISKRRTTTPAICAAIQADNTDVVNYLLNRGANPDIFAGLPLCQTLYNEQWDLMELLLKHGANPNPPAVCQHSICTPLVYVKLTYGESHFAYKMLRKYKAREEVDDALLKEDDEIRERFD